MAELLGKSNAVAKFLEDASGVAGTSGCLFAASVAGTRGASGGTTVGASSTAGIADV